MPISRPYLATAGNMWRPGTKPWPPHTAEYDPNGRLSRALGGLVLFENCAKAGFIDYVQPWNKLVFVGAGTSQAATVSPYGGRAFSTSAADTNKDGASWTTGFASIGIWSLSVLIKFDGTGAGPLTASPDIVQNGAITSGLGVTGDGSDVFNWTADGSGALTPAITTWSTWTRLTFTADGTSWSLYANGKLQSTSTPNSTTFAAQSIALSWPWPMADFFWWNRTLSASEVAQHNSDPFGTTMRPKADEWTTVGVAAAGVVKKQGLLTTGVGP